MKLADAEFDVTARSPRIFLITVELENFAIINVCI